MKGFHVLSRFLAAALLVGATAYARDGANHHWHYHRDGEG